MYLMRQFCLSNFVLPWVLEAVAVPEALTCRQRLPLSWPPPELLSLPWEGEEAAVEAVAAVVEEEGLAMTVLSPGAAGAGWGRVPSAAVAVDWQATACPSVWADGCRSCSPSLKNINYVFE